MPTTSAGGLHWLERVRHPAVGDIELTYEVFDVSTDNDLRLIVYTTQPGSRRARTRCKLLASWIATQDKLARTYPTRP